MNFDELAASLTPDMYSRLKESVELGKWPSGEALTREQKALCLEALLKYEISQGIPEDQRIGYVPVPEKPGSSTDDTQVLQIRDDGETLQ